MIEWPIFYVSPGFRHVSVRPRVCLFLYNWMTDWMLPDLPEWVSDSLIIWLPGKRWIDWSTNQFTDRLIGWLVAFDWLVHWPVDSRLRMERKQRLEEICSHWKEVLPTFADLPVLQRCNDGITALHTDARQMHDRRHARHYVTKLVILIQSIREV